VAHALSIRRNAQRHAAKVAANSSRHVQRLRAALKLEKTTLERHHTASANHLHRMQRACGGAAIGERAEFARIQATARVQHDSAASLLTAHFGQVRRNTGKLRIGSAQQQHVRSQQLPRELRMRPAIADRAHRMARCRFSARDNRTDAPAGDAQPTAQRTSDATCADDSDGEWTVC
jgi:hypothetical protein